MIRYHTPPAVSDQALLKDGVDVCSVAGELGESGASHDVADRGGGRYGVVLDDLLLGASWDWACRRTALGTWEGNEGRNNTHSFFHPSKKPRLGDTLGNTDDLKHTQVSGFQNIITVIQHSTLSVLRLF